MDGLLGLDLDLRLLLIVSGGLVSRVLTFIIVGNGGTLRLGCLFDGRGRSGRHRHGQVGCRSQLLGLIAHGAFLLGDFIGILLLEVNTDLVVNEGDDHAVVQWDQRRWRVLGHLATTLHEHKGSV